LVAAQAYLYTTWPNLGDPREHMHRAALNGLKMVCNKLSAKEEEAYRNKGNHKPRSPRHHNSPRHRSRSCRSRTPSPGRYNSPKNKGTRCNIPDFSKFWKIKKKYFKCLYLFDLVEKLQEIKTFDLILKFYPHKGSP
jgi:hypothetical protein